MTGSWGQARVSLGDLYKDILYMNFVTTGPSSMWADGTVVQTWVSVPDPNIPGVL